MVMAPFLELPADILREVASFSSSRDLRSSASAHRILQVQLEDWCSDKCAEVHGWPALPFGTTSSDFLLALDDRSLQNAAFDHSDCTAESGEPIICVEVGGCRQLAHAQTPPHEGDSFVTQWSPTRLLKGSYTLAIAGGVNPHHGILSMSLVLGEEGAEQKEIQLGQLDWFNVTSSSPITFYVSATLPQTTRVRIRGRVNSKHEEAHDFWMTLLRFSLSPVAS